MIRHPPGMAQRRRSSAIGTSHARARPGTALRLHANRLTAPPAPIRGGQIGDLQHPGFRSPVAMGYTRRTGQSRRQYHQDRRQPRGPSRTAGRRRDRRETRLPICHFESAFGRGCCASRSSSRNARSGVTPPHRRPESSDFPASPKAPRARTSAGSDATVRAAQDRPRWRRFPQEAGRQVANRQPMALPPRHGSTAPTAAARMVSRPRGRDSADTGSRRSIEPRRACLSIPRAA